MLVACRLILLLLRLLVARLRVVRRVGWDDLRQNDGWTFSDARGADILPWYDLERAYATSTAARGAWNQYLLVFNALPFVSGCLPISPSPAVNAPLLPPLLYVHLPPTFPFFFLRVPLAAGRVEETRAAAGERPVTATTVRFQADWC